MAGTWNKREREQKKRNAKKQKEERKLERKENSLKGKSMDQMMAYVDEYGNLSDTPPDKNAKPAEVIIPPTVANSNALQQADPFRKGIITFFDSSKGYGFIKDAQTQESIFVHVSASPIELKENLKVVFEVERGPKGLVAANIKADV
ncbi:MAG: cold shock domain-containing protein [Niabella sp.]